MNAKHRTGRPPPMRPGKRKAQPGSIDSQYPDRSTNGPAKQEVPDFLAPLIAQQFELVPSIGTFDERFGYQVTANLLPRAAARVSRKG